MELSCRQMVVNCTEGMNKPRYMMMTVFGLLAVQNCLFILRSFDQRNHQETCCHTCSDFALQSNLQIFYCQKILLFILVVWNLFEYKLMRFLTNVCKQMESEADFWVALWTLGGRPPWNLSGRTPDQNSYQTFSNLLSLTTDEYKHSRGLQTSSSGTIYLLPIKLLITV